MARVFLDSHFSMGSTQAGSTSVQLSYPRNLAMPPQIQSMPLSKYGRRLSVHRHKNGIHPGGRTSRTHISLKNFMWVQFRFSPMEIESGSAQTLNLGCSARTGTRASQGFSLGCQSRDCLLGGVNKFNSWVVIIMFQTCFDRAFAIWLFNISMENPL